MLFQPEELKKTRVDNNGGLENPVRKKRRYGIIREGKTVLVKLELAKNADGSFDIRQPKVVKSIGVKCTIEEGKQKGRWFWDRLVISGYEPEVQRKNEIAIAGAMCHGLSSAKISLLDGLVVPALIKVRNHWETGKEENYLYVLNPHPDHYDNEHYHDLVKRVMVPNEDGSFDYVVPGWNLYPSSLAYSLVQKRIKDRTERDESGMTQLDKRRLAGIKRIEDKFSG